MKKILVICETTDFQNFTRRATIEAIHDVYPNLQLLLCGGWNAFLKGKKSKSKIIPSRFYLYLFPKRMRGSFLFKLLSQFIDKIFLWKYFSKFDIVFFLKPSDDFFISNFRRQKKIFLISDPYHLYRNEENLPILSSVKTIYNSSDIILTTSINLKNNYVPKYIEDKNLDKVYYWPNTVDLNIWDYKKYRRQKSNDKVVIGFIGNFMNVTDVELLNIITSEFQACKFRIIGKITYSNIKYNEELKRIFNKKNVEYMGFIEYNKLPEMVSHFDIGILLDKKNEIASYHHHNKLYQYLALGKPVITMNYLADYNSLKGVFIAKNTLKYIEIMKGIIEKIKNNQYNPEISVKTAESNSSSIRGKEFIHIMKENNIL